MSIISFYRSNTPRLPNFHIHFPKLNLFCMPFHKICTKPHIHFLLNTNFCMPPGTTNNAANRQPLAARRQPPATSNQPPAATSSHQQPATSHHQQPLATSNQPPTTSRRHPGTEHRKLVSLPPPANEVSSW